MEQFRTWVNRRHSLSLGEFEIFGKVNQCFFRLSIMPLIYFYLFFLKNLCQFFNRAGLDLQVNLQ